jgi:hypothetical protein
MSDRLCGSWSFDSRVVCLSWGQQWFNYTKGCWQWDLEKIEGMQYTDNVVEFMAQDLRKLPNEVLACSPHATM